MKRRRLKDINDWLVWVKERKKATHYRQWSMTMGTKGVVLKPWTETIAYRTKNDLVTQPASFPCLVMWETGMDGKSYFVYLDEILKDVI